MRQERVINPRYPHRIKITRNTLDDDGDEITKTLYEGPGHSFTDTTTNGDQRMQSNRRKAAIPVRFSQWLEALLPNDILEVKMGKVVEEGEIKDFEPDNDRTMIYWEYGRM